MMRLRNLVSICSLAVMAMACLPQNKDKGGDPRPALADASCGSRTASTCTANTNCQISGTQCVGTSTYCSNYKDEPSCPASSCQWSVSGSSCAPIVPFTPANTDTSISVNCGNYFQANTCPSPSCVWNGVQCLANAGTNNPTNTNTNTNTNQTNTNTNTGQVPPIVNPVCDQIGQGLLAQAPCWTTSGCRYYFCALGFCDNKSGVVGCHAQGIP